MLLYLNIKLHTNVVEPGQAFVNKAGKYSFFSTDCSGLTPSRSSKGVKLSLTTDAPKETECLKFSIPTKQFLQAWCKTPVRCMPVTKVTIDLLGNKLLNVVLNGSEIVVNEYKNKPTEHIRSRCNNLLTEYPELKLLIDKLVKSSINAISTKDKKMLAVLRDQYHTLPSVIQEEFAYWQQCFCFGYQYDGILLSNIH